MKVLVTGGAGYIGSTVCSACLDSGLEPIILDNLATGRREFTKGRLFYEGDIADGALIDRIFRDHPDLYAVIHCAALIVVPESVANPARYYRENVTKTIELASHLAGTGVSGSSSARPRRSMLRATASRSTRPRPSRRRARTPAPRP